MTGRRLGPAVVAVLAGLVIAACATAPAPSPRPTAVPAPEEPSLTLPPGGATAGPSESVKPAPTVAPPVLDEAALTCGSLDLVFPAAALDRPAGQERGSAPEQAALRVYLESPEVVPDRLADDRLVGRRRRAGPGHLPRPGERNLVGRDLRAARPTGWEFSEGGECPLQVALPDGVGFASWRLDPATPPTPERRRSGSSAPRLNCANGKAPVGRVLAPIVLARRTP